jgi:hypothetical protein
MRRGWRRGSTVRMLNILLLSRGFDGPGAAAFLRTLYGGRFDGLEQRLQRQPAPPEWWV